MRFSLDFSPAVNLSELRVHSTPPDRECVTPAAESPFASCPLTRVRPLVAMSKHRDDMQVSRPTATAGLRRRVERPRGHLRRGHGRDGMLTGVSRCHLLVVVRSVCWTTNTSMKSVTRSRCRSTTASRRSRPGCDRSCRRCSAATRRWRSTPSACSSHPPEIRSCSRR
jgi:hypothetical protein